MRVKHYQKHTEDMPRWFQIMLIVWLAVGSWLVFGQSIKDMVATPAVEAQNPLANVKMVEVKHIDTPELAPETKTEAPKVAEPLNVYKKYFGDKADEAQKIAKCESGERANAQNKNKNGSSDYGLFQINSIWLAEFGLTAENLLSAETNAKVAKAIYDRSGGWSAWYSSKKCHKLTN